MENKNIIITAVVILVLLAAGWYLASPLFINKTVNEESPMGTEEASEMMMEEGMVDEFMDDDFGFEMMGTFMDADNFHKTSGTAKIIQAGDIQYLRLEDFETTNGPDLYVYLSNDLNSDDFVSLGRLKGNIGNQNYEVPSDINAEDYDYVLIWCKQFSVLFGSAELG